LSALFAVVGHCAGNRRQKLTNPGGGGTAMDAGPIGELTGVWNEGAGSTVVEKS
jgi:hypothetical protein